MCIANMMKKNPEFRAHLQARAAERQAQKSEAKAAPVASSDPRALSSGASPRAGLQIR